MDLHTEQAGGVTVVFVGASSLDAGNTAEFKKQIEPALKAGNQVVLALGQVEFLDSSGIGALLSCLRELGRRGGDLKLCEATKSVRAICELVRLHKIVEIFNTKEEAIRAFSAPGV